MTQKQESPALSTQVFIVGGGLAGMLLALHLAPLRVALVHPDLALGRGTSSSLARGGVACPLAPHDHPDLHIHDTCIAADGLAKEEVVRALIEESCQDVPALKDLGVEFDHEADGQLHFGLEAAHGIARILSSGHDATGASLVEAIRQKVEQADHIDKLFGYHVVALSADKNQIDSITLRGPDSKLYTYKALAVALATGGLGQLYQDSSNPTRSQGHGAALAHRVGASLLDMEFVQFHPTGLLVDKRTKPLLTEALRGEGARLIDQNGAFLQEDGYDVLELAPRDIVSRAVYRHIVEGNSVFLDARHLGGRLAERFPRALLDCQEAGLDPYTQPLPITPVAHYHMGGIEADLQGKTSVGGFWALGEVASTGLHGANRLASNSLMEAIVMASRVAADMRDVAARGQIGQKALVIESDLVWEEHGAKQVEVIEQIRSIMSQHVAIVRTQSGLERAVEALQSLEQGAKYYTYETSLSLHAAQLIAQGALQRKESRGAHFRPDFPMHSERAQHLRAFYDQWSFVS